VVEEAGPLHSPPHPYILGMLNQLKIFTEAREVKGNPRKRFLAVT